MNIIIDLLQNPLFLSAASAWFVSQLCKIIYETVRCGFRPKRLVGGGGMPSSHSATVTGLAMGSCLTYGTKSPEFAISIFLAIVVIYDAVGVRQVTGKQSRILNEMRKNDLANKRNPFFETPLDEHMGHTLPEVIAGCLVGISCALLMCLALAPAIQRLLTS